MLVGSAFAAASERRSLPSIRGITVLTPGIPGAAGRRLVLRLPASRRPTSVSFSKHSLAAVVAEARAGGADADRLVVLRLSRGLPQAVEVTGRLRRPSDYLRALSTIAGAPPVGRGAYYELEDSRGKVLMRFGLVNGLAPKDRLVAWVRPDLLRRW